MRLIVKSFSPNNQKEAEIKLKEKSSKYLFHLFEKIGNLVHLYLNFRNSDEKNTFKNLVETENMFGEKKEVEEPFFNAFNLLKPEQNKNECNFLTDFNFLEFCTLKNLDKNLFSKDFEMTDNNEMNVIFSAQKYTNSNEKNKQKQNNIKINQFSDINRINTGKNIANQSNNFEKLNPSKKEPEIIKKEQIYEKKKDLKKSKKNQKKRGSQRREDSYEKKTDQEDEKRAQNKPEFQKFNKYEPVHPDLTYSSFNNNKLDSDNIIKASENFQLPGNFAQNYEKEDKYYKNNYQPKTNHKLGQKGYNFNNPNESHKNYLDCFPNNSKNDKPFNNNQYKIQNDFHKFNPQNSNQNKAYYTQAYNCQLPRDNYYQDIKDENKRYEEENKRMNKKIENQNKKNNAKVDEFVQKNLNEIGEQKKEELSSKNCNLNKYVQELYEINPQKNQNEDKKIEKDKKKLVFKNKNEFFVKEKQAKQLNFQESEFTQKNNIPIKKNPTSFAFYNTGFVPGLNHYLNSSPRNPIYYNENPNNCPKNGNLNEPASNPGNNLDNQSFQNYPTDKIKLLKRN